MLDIAGKVLKVLMPLLSWGALIALILIIYGPPNWRIALIIFIVAVIAAIYIMRKVISHFAKKEGPAKPLH